MNLKQGLQLKDEKSLVNGCINNDRFFQNQLYKIFVARMMGVCLRYAQTREDAEDILQEGFMQVFCCIEQFKFKSSLEAWMKKIFINCALQKLRKKENSYSFISIHCLTETASTLYIEPDTIDLKKLIQCIQNLPVVSRLVFNLYVFEGFKHKEIAEMLNISEGTSKSNLFDARQNLKKQLIEFDISKKTVAHG
ncbi:MAG: sigma-70 family RNA polymerase sigma factor [Parafilimonas sp.]|nr:sigma-70 family RNA polymerase sigma factor [Parafilimonas sp.]